MRPRLIDNCILIVTLIKPGFRLFRTAAIRLVALFGFSKRISNALHHAFHRSASLLGVHLLIRRTRNFPLSFTLVEEIVEWKCDYLGTV